jgi:hypothetical protein
MNCYYCETQSGPGGTRFAIAMASAVCVSCGAGVCRAHSVAAPNQSGIRCVTCSTSGVAATKEITHG